VHQHNPNCETGKNSADQQNSRAGFPDGENQQCDLIIQQVKSQQVDGIPGKVFSGTYTREELENAEPHVNYSNTDTQNNDPALQCSGSSRDVHVFFCCQVEWSDEKKL
jgi:hypothetical protein